MIYTILDLEGKELYASTKIDNLPEGQIAVPELRTESYGENENIYFDFQTKTFYNKIN